MKVVYTLVTNQQNYIPEMCALSAAAAKRYTPGIQCCAVMDSWTHRFLRDERPYLLDHLDETVVTDRVYEDAVRMSRHLKTSMRQLVTGDFLFIDADAIPVQDISALFRLDCDFAGTQNGNCRPASYVVGRAEKEIFDAMGWPIPRGLYLNSGVLLAKDSPAVHQLFDKWHLLWKESATKGFNKDQPALHMALQQAPVQFRLLPPKWNAMISLYTGGSYKPKIVHFSTIRFDERNDTIFHDMVRRIRIDGRVELDELERARARQFYWTDRESVAKQLRTGNVDRAVAVAGRKLIGRAGGVDRNPASTN